MTDFPLDFASRPKSAVGSASARERGKPRGSAGGLGGRGWKSRQVPAGRGRKRPMPSALGLMFAPGPSRLSPYIGFV